MISETVLTNALLVLPAEVVPGTVVLRDGLIAELQRGRSGVGQSNAERRRRCCCVFDARRQQLRRNAAEQRQSGIAAAARSE